jgi:hypothetical protein
MNKKYYRKYRLNKQNFLYLLLQKKAIFANKNRINYEKFNDKLHGVEIEKPCNYW